MLEYVDPLGFCEAQDRNSLDFEGETALLSACEVNSVEAVRLLIEPLGVRSRLCPKTRPGTDFGTPESSKRDCSDPLGR